MKKNYFMLAAASMFLLSACSNDEDIAKGLENESGTQELVLQVASSGDGLVTRAGRPLYSSEANQTIDKVTLIFMDKTSKEVQVVKEITGWIDKSSVYDTNGHGRQHTISLKGDDKLTEGTYTVFAVGYTSTGSLYTFLPELITATKGSTFDGQAVKTTSKAEEIFAGEIASIEVNEDKSFNLTANTKNNVLTLHRQVAGSFGYFKNIPATVNGKNAASIRLVAVNKNMKAEFKDFNSAFTATNADVQYIVNGGLPTAKDAKFAGSSTDDANVVYSIGLSSWFTGGDTNNNGVLDNSDTWENPLAPAFNSVKGAVFAGEFVIPFALADGKSTMQLQLLDVDGNIIKHWGVNIPLANVATGKSAPELNDKSASVFNVYRNHMYNIGVKVGNEPNQPETPDVEEPEDLSKGQDITLKVNDNWEMLHRLELD